jgi:hypothetical protein
MGRPDPLVLALARLVRGVAEREARERAERHARLRLVDSTKPDRAA